MRQKCTCQAFLEIQLEQEEGVLPVEYDVVLNSHVHSIPTSFYLRWPTRMIPLKGSEIVLSAMPAPWDTLEVCEVDYHYSAKSGYAAYIRCAISDEGRPLDLFSLLHASDEGFLLESFESIKDVLKRAGLISSIRDYREIKPT